MTTDPEQIHGQVAELLAGLPDIDAGECAGADLDADLGADLDAVAGRLEAAHELLVAALESVEKG